MPVWPQVRWFGKAAPDARSEDEIRLGDVGDVGILQPDVSGSRLDDDVAARLADVGDVGELRDAGRGAEDDQVHAVFEVGHAVIVEARPRQDELVCDSPDRQNVEALPAVEAVLAIVAVERSVEDIGPMVDGLGDVINTQFIIVDRSAR